MSVPPSEWPATAILAGLTGPAIPPRSWRDDKGQVEGLLGIVADRFSRQRAGRVGEGRRRHQVPGGRPRIEQGLVDAGIRVPPVGKHDQRERTGQPHRTTDDRHQGPPRMPRDIATVRRGPARIGERLGLVLDRKGGLGRRLRGGRGGGRGDLDRPDPGAGSVRPWAPPDRPVDGDGDGHTATASPITTTRKSAATRAPRYRCMPRQFPIPCWRRPVATLGTDGSGPDRHRPFRPRWGTHRSGRR